MAPGLSLSDVFSAGTTFAGGLILLFFADLGLMHMLGVYTIKKRWGPAGVFLALLLIINGWFYAYQKGHLLEKAMAEKPESSVTVADPGPPLRNYDFIKKQQFIRDRKKGLYNVIDETGFSVNLRRDMPPTVYPESFSILSQNEGLDLKDKKRMIDFARFIILLYYNESEPFYPESADELKKFLSYRKDPVKREIAKILADELNRPGAVPPIAVPEGEEWDLDGEVYTFGGAGSSGAIRRLSPPSFETDWEGGVCFRLYSFSMRKNELVEWQFRVTPYNEIMLKILTRITPPKMPEPGHSGNER